MTPTRLRQVLGVVHWSQRGLAAILDCSDRLVRMWAAGQAPVPADVEEWLERIAAVHEAHPLPTQFRRPPGRRPS